MKKVGKGIEIAIVIEIVIVFELTSAHSIFKP